MTILQAKFSPDEYHEDVIGVLEKELELARSGKCEFVAVVICRDAMVRTNFSKSPRIMELIGSVDQLRHNIMAINRESE